MKKLIIFTLLVSMTAFIFGQGASPSDQVRVANATTAFGVNIPIGTTVYDVGADKYYVCKTASISTLTLTTGSANFTLIGGTNGTVTEITVGSNLNVTDGTSTPHITANTGIEGDSLVKMSATAESGDFAKFDANGLTGRTVAEMQSDLSIRLAIVEDFEQANDSLSGHSIYQLSHTPVAGTMSVQLNGMNLKPTSQYTIVETNKLRIGTSVYKYDQVSISYSY